jgi:LysM repeat protein/tetratricopeptide (TPR) repeat protein
MNYSFLESYFVDGGTLRAETPSYVKRPADDELFNSLLNREYCYILTPRQMGKSSLMIRTSQRLKEENIKTAIVDIQGIGTDKIKEWYASLLSQIRRGLRLKVDIDEWMKQKSIVGYGQLFVDFVQDVVLAEISVPVVIFLDEVDWMIKIDFRDDFFASIRSIYNARAQYPEFERISFVLLGVASPADLIAEPTRTPFNIGHAIPLQELSLKDATPLQDGLEQVCPGESKRILERIFYWTNGHPYLTQKLCKSIAESSKRDWSDAEVDRLVESLFLTEESRKEANLKFIQDRILTNEHRAQMLKLYERVRQTKIPEKGQSVIQNQLLLSGLLASRDGFLEIRNRIYGTVFDDRWIKRNTPRNLQRIALISMGSALAVLVLAILAVFAYDLWIGYQINRRIADFISTTSSSQRLSDLAYIYGKKGILSNTQNRLVASQLFYGLSAKEDQLSMFTDSAIDSSVDFQYSLLTVIDNLYVTVADVDATNDNTLLLKTMGDSLGKVSTDMDAAKALQLRNEIVHWLDGRDKYHAGNYQEALSSYNSAIDLNSGNPATIYERARVYLVLKQYDKALLDLDKTIEIAKANQPARNEESSTTNPVLSGTVPVTETLPPLSAIQDIPIARHVSSGTTPIGFTFSVQSIKPTGVYFQLNKFESMFSTFIEIVNAVKRLIESDPVLQAAIQASGNDQFVSLKPYFSTPTPTPTLPPDQPTFTSAPATDTLPVLGSPTVTPEFLEYTVQPGDSLASIALRFGVDVNVLIQLNQVSDADILLVGETLNIPTTSFALTAMVQTPTPGTFVPSTSISATPTATIEPTRIDTQLTTPIIPTTSIPPGPFSSPAEIVMGFSPIQIQLGSTSQLNIVIYNLNLFPLTNASLTNNLPAGITVVGIAGNSCGGTLTAPTGSSTFALSGSTVPAQSGGMPGSCTVSLDVTPTAVGNFTHTLPAGALSSIGAGGSVTNAYPASASLTVLP